MEDSVIPIINIEEDVVLESYDMPESETVEDISIKRSFNFNSETKQFIFLNGKNVETSQVEAIKQWVRLILRTYKDKFNVYKDTDFYCNIEDLIGNKLNPFLDSELRREITEAMLRNKAIKSVDNIALSQSKRTLTVEFTITLKDTALISINEVI